MAITSSVSGAESGRNVERRMLVRMMAVCGVLIAGGSAAHVVSTNHPPAALSLGDVSEAHIVEIRDQKGATVLSGEFRSRVDALGNTEKDAGLTDGSGREVTGEVEVEVPAPNRADRRPELEVDIIGLPPRGTFNLVIDDRIVASFTTDDRGSIDVELQQGEVPPNRLKM